MTTLELRALDARMRLLQRHCQKTINCLQRDPPQVQDALTNLQRLSALLQIPEVQRYRDEVLGKTVQANLP